MKKLVYNATSGSKMYFPIVGNWSGKEEKDVSNEEAEILLKLPQITEVKASRVKVNRPAKRVFKIEPDNKVDDNIEDENENKIKKEVE